MKRLAEPLAGTTWASVNSTFSGGGVAEMLRSIIPLAAGLGIDAQWWAIEGSEDFFKVTKKFHNLLQGRPESLTLDEIFGAYLDTIDQNALKTHIAADVVEIHDPQPAAMIMSGVLYGKVLWRSHIDTSSPDKVLWRFLLPYINQCAGAIFTLPKFAGPGLNIPHYQIYPSIDPLAVKNRQLSEAEALEVLGPLFHDHDIDPERPIIAAVSRYDPHKNQAGILEAFRLLRRGYSGGPPPYLIFLGNTASDDPEGESILRDLQQLAGDDPDVRFLVNVEDNDRVVGALMRQARLCVQVSTKEGFGLVVAEAAWQGTPVIGSTAGGIDRQIVDGMTGYVVEPNDVEALASRMSQLLGDKDEARRMGEGGMEHIRQNFLLPSMLVRYLPILQLYTGKTTSLPASRINRLSYSEIQDHFVSPKRGWLGSHTELPSTPNGEASKPSYLVMAHHTLGSPQLLGALSEIQATEPEAEFVLLVPETGTRPEVGSSEVLPMEDEDQSRLTAIRTLESSGVRIERVEVTGDRPLDALENELRSHSASFKGTILSTLPKGMSFWLESGLVDRAASFGPPVMHVVSLKSPADSQKRPSIASLVEVNEGAAG